MIIPDTNAKDVAAMANHLWIKIYSQVFSCGLPMTCSFGLSVYKPQSNNSIKKMFEAADAALYKAKKDEHNRVEY
jgi:GGDEF domain-containing protein